MPNDQAQTLPGGLAGRLIRDQLLSAQQARRAQTECSRRRQSLIRYLLAEKVVDGGRLAAAASQEFGIPLLDLDAIDRQHLPLSLVDAKLIHRHRVLPIHRRGSRLFVAVSDPTDDRALEEIRFHTGLAVDAIVVEEAKLAAALDQAIDAQDSAMTDLLDTALDHLEISSDDEDDVGNDDSDFNVDDAPVVRYVNKVLLDAISASASDIHFEPYEKFFRIRYRQDGLLREVASPPLSIASRLVARLKVMSRMNIAERRVPQDGRIKLKMSRNRDIDFRVSTLPTLYGEKVVLRILDSAATTVGIDELGMEPEQKAAFLECIRNPYGMVLVTGPTGSGKTVSLYSALNIVNAPDINIATVEDPVEIQVPGINQVNMNPKTGMTFAAALRAFLRQDPDIVMVGEIRDLETAEIAVKAAQTGHLVLSTLHTNDAPQCLTRLANMGVAPFNIAASVLLIMAQRLVRRLCLRCREPDHLPREALREAGFTEAQVAAGITVYKAVGCDHCVDGYKGRVGIFQVIKVSADMGRIIMEGGSAMALATQADNEGYLDLRQAGLRKVQAGVTSLLELNRVTKD
ncbi:type IV-A pilus assembly ATPase PilB [uncultured Thiohalocapsa sp.]|uniref:type IV-A pilus assembly ATPase PilB n=1 Tax=uncultured Thiohalocapsa sp. TaxID=768990 RepID=UPI0025D9E49E|nr:type IV-A pilus assembly ATPase PilB [uncultured Thiohalocapsa sp.]